MLFFFLSYVVWNLLVLQHHYENGYFHISQNKPIIRTHLLSERFGSDYRCLVRLQGLEPGTP